MSGTTRPDKQLPESHQEFIDEMVKALKPNRLPADFIRHIARGSYMIRIDWTTYPTDDMRLQIHKSGDSKLTLVFDLNGMEMGRLDFYAAD